MNKILLELTEKEAEAIKEVLGLEKESISKDKIGFTEQQRKTGICNSIIGKIGAAFEPKTEMLIRSQDLFDLISLAKGEYHHIRANTFISNKRVEEGHLIHIALANALISWLNGKSLLKNNVKFDITG